MKVKKRVEGERTEKDGFVFKKIKKGSLASRPVKNVKEGKSLKTVPKKKWFSGNSENISDAEYMEIFRFLSEGCNDIVQSFSSKAVRSDIKREVIGTLNEWLNEVERKLSGRRENVMPQEPLSSSQEELLELQSKKKILEEVLTNYEKECARWKEFCDTLSCNDVENLEPIQVEVPDAQFSSLETQLDHTARSLEIQIDGLESMLEGIEDICTQAEQLCQDLAKDCERDLFGVLPSLTPRTLIRKIVGTEQV